MVAEDEKLQNGRITHSTGSAPAVKVAVSVAEALVDLQTRVLTLDFRRSAISVPACDDAVRDILLTALS